jgi:hypothetical protein
VSVREKGVYKLNLSDNTMSLFKDGELKVVAFGKNSSSRLTVDFNYLKRIKFIKNDLYIETSSSLIKISDFQTKFAAAEK